MTNHKPDCFSMGRFRHPISMTEFSHQYDFKLLKLVTYLISKDKFFSTEIGSVAFLKIKNIEIININTNHIDFIPIEMPSHCN